MRRLLLCVPLCLLMAPEDASNARPSNAALLANVSDDGGALPAQAQMPRLAQTDPVAFLEACVKRYDREVKGYHCSLHKQERLDGKLQSSEEIDAWFREEPFSVRMEWREGVKLAKETLFVKGENKDKILVKGAGLLAIAGIVERDPNGPDAKTSSRYPITEFGMQVGCRRTLASWKKAVQDNALHIEYLGEVKVKEAGDRTCWKLHRTGYKGPEDIDGVGDLILYIDTETWLQVGSTVKTADGQLLADYFFKDVEINPDIKADTFTREALAR